MMQVVMVGMRGSLGDDAGVLDPVSKLLDEALREPATGMPADRVGKLVRRAKRVTNSAMAGLGRQVLGVQYLAIARFTADLAARDVIVVGADSPFARAWDLMAEVLNLAGDDLVQLESEADAAAVELGRVLRSEGYFRLSFG